MTEVKSISGGNPGNPVKSASGGNPGPGGFSASGGISVPENNGIRHADSGVPAVCGDCGDPIRWEYGYGPEWRGHYEHEDGSRLCGSRIAAVKRKPGLLQRYYPEEGRDLNPVPAEWIRALGLTRVIFRAWRAKKDQSWGAVIALFPDETRERRPGMCLCYEHVGQHGDGAYAMIMRRTRIALPHEYADLRRELESAPYSYKLVPVRRANGRQHAAAAK